MGLDGVELVVAFEDAFGVGISDAEAEVLLTPKHVIDLLCQRLPLVPSEDGCITQRAFHRVRRCLIRVTGLDRETIRLGTRVRAMFPKPYRKERWRAFCDCVGMPDLPNLSFGTGSLMVRDIVNRAAVRGIQERSRDRKWTRSEVRETVRQIIRDELGIKEFSDDDQFARDLGIG